MVIDKKKGSGLNQIRKRFRKFSKQIKGSDKRKPVFIKRITTPFFAFYLFSRDPEFLDIYLKKKLKKRVKDHGIFCSCSSSPGSSTLCGIDCSCGMLLSSCSSSCKCTCGCTNKPFQQRHIKKMKLVQVGMLQVGIQIDATYKGNKSRHFNHSCNPNTEMQKWIIDGETRIGIFATRYITKGEHLTYDYQFVQFGADQDCYCGASCCRKQLGAKASKAKNIPACKVVTWKPPKLLSSEVRENNLDALGQSRNYCGERKTCRPNCIGVIFMLARPTNQRLILSCTLGVTIFLTVINILRCFGIIRQFDEVSRKHLVTYEDGVTEAIDTTCLSSY
ncbi:hypothetical protein BRARA_D00194 [Brassica rapa]|uniref:SET domain-containing protein n=1 Tax=Brassica campestris TaxID=3711 RepID=A0A397ZHL6_BRACM|nr:hypothetical protein BRARA_D00194 [Brassica rapa]